MMHSEACRSTFRLRKPAPLCGLALTLTLCACTDREQPVPPAAPPDAPSARPAPGPEQDEPTAPTTAPAADGANRCPPGKFFVHGGCFSGDDVGVAGPAKVKPPSPDGARVAPGSPTTEPGQSERPCPPGQFFVHGGCFSGDDVGERRPAPRAED